MFNEIIINNIKLSEKIISNTNDINNLLEYLNTNYVFDINKCLGNGGSCILAYHVNNCVVKICIKYGLLNDVSKFILHHDKLFSIGIPIIKINKILFENKSFVIYSQNCCKQIELNNNNLLEILKIIRIMVNNNYIVPDIYYTNFGIYENSIKLYDYHDIVISEGRCNASKGCVTETNCYDLYLIQLAYMFSFVKYNTGFKNNNINLSKNEIIKSHFGKNYLDNDVILLLEALNNNDNKLIMLMLDAIINRMINNNTLIIIDYQQLFIDNNNILNLFSHTQLKYNFIIKNLHNILQTPNISVIDAGCCVGGIGGKIAQTYINANVTLNNITENEIKTCHLLKNKLYLENVIINTDNIINITEKYDITLYFAILHHILKSFTFKQIINLIKQQTNKYAIIELPFKPDKLLDLVIANTQTKYEESYYYLENVNNFINEMTKYFKLITYERINYGDNFSDMNRYVFLFSHV